jgi:oligopeptidase A
MTAEILTPPERTTVLNAETVLDEMMVRLEAILAEPALTPQTLVEVTAIFNNVSYLFLYLEANDDHINFTRLLPKRDIFYRNLSLDRRILAKLHACAFDDPQVEKSRMAYVCQLSEKLAAGHDSATEQINLLRARARKLEDAVTADQLDRIQKLGLPVNGERPSTIFYRVISRTTRPEIREKLARLWTLTGQAHRIEMASVIDQIISIRRGEASAPNRSGSPLAETLRKCRIDESAVGPFLERYIELALLEQRRLEDEIASALNGVSVPIAHFSYYLRRNFGRQSAPLFDLNACLDYIFSVAKAVFGLDFAVTQNDLSPVIFANVRRNAIPVGKINFDLWASHGKDLGANHTIGLRNRAEWGDIVQRPEAWVSCRFESRRSGERLITFQNVHSLFHEFGHAINHLLVQEDIPNQSGLEYLPLERLEYLSMWFEKWIYHRAFGEHLGLSEAELDGLRLCQTAKKIEYRRTYVERAVASFLDFECHRRTDVTLRECFDELDAKHRVSSFVHFPDFPPYFTWPMFVANPGANFSYLWGAAWSCTHFCPLEDKSLSEIASHPGASGWFEPCFRFEMPSTAPDPQSIFSFYGTSDAPARHVDGVGALA